MNAIKKSFRIFVLQLTKDGMLIMILIAPILVGTIFKFGVPFIELQLTRYFVKDVILGDYFLLFDLLLATLTPYLISFAASMTMLDEYDSNLINHLCVTPLGKRGYLISRVVLPLLLAFIISIVIVSVFSLTSWSLLMVISICLLTSLLSLTSTLIVFSFSNNKIEGLALAKLSGVVMIGIVVPFTITSEVQYYFLILPSFWIGKLTLDLSLNIFIISFFSILIWVFVLYKKFLRKLSK
ncbi:ABC transporter permease [Mycoplasmatota bacterium WC30]